MLFGRSLPIYRDIGLTPVREQPTAAAAIAIDMGWPFLCGLIVVAVIGAIILFRRSLSRDQGYLYAAVGAGASIALLTSAFAEYGILNLGASLLTAALYGLVCGQGIPANQADDARSAVEQDLTPSPVYHTRWARIALDVSRTLSSSRKLLGSSPPTGIFVSVSQVLWLFRASSCPKTRQRRSRFRPDAA